MDTGVVVALAIMLLSIAVVFFSIVAHLDSEDQHYEKSREERNADWNKHLHELNTTLKASNAAVALLRYRMLKESIGPSDENGTNPEWMTDKELDEKAGEIGRALGLKPVHEDDPY